MLGFKGLSSNISYFVAILSFVARSALLHDMYCILYRIKFSNLQLAGKHCICRVNSKYAPDKNFWRHFCPCRKAANFCHPAWARRLLLYGIYYILYLTPLTAQISASKFQNLSQFPLKIRRVWEIVVFELKITQNVKTHSKF